MQIERMGMKILIVEDEYAIRSFITLNFREKAPSASKTRRSKFLRLTAERKPYEFLKKMKI